MTEADYARGRLVGHTYWSKSYPLPNWWGDDAGYPGRFVYKVFDHDDRDDEATDACEWSEAILRNGPRIQIKVLIGREMGRVKQFRIQRVPSSGDATDLLKLYRQEALKLITLVKTLDHLPLEGDEGTRVDDDTIRALLSDPQGMRQAYQRDPVKFTSLITEDVSASDVIAIANRRRQVAIFHRLLRDHEFFAKRQVELAARGREEVWQKFIEENPWILGVGLSGQLLTSWDPRKLEQVVAGSSISTTGKRVDALMRTVGAVSSMVFAEIKHHETDLLDGEDYRTDCWAPSKEVAGGVTQIQQTVYLAREAIKERIRSRDADGNEAGDLTFMIRPRCYLIAGHLNQLAPNGNVNLAKVRSFELYRRNLYEPEIVTFDELLARAEWHLAEAERKAAT